MIKKNKNVKEILIDYDQIENQTKLITKEIVSYYQHQVVEDNSVVLVGLLKGSVPFMGLFLRFFDYDCETNYMAVSSYLGGTKSSGEPKMLLDIDRSIKNKHVLIIEDIIDSGFTLKYIKELLYFKGAKDVKIVTLLDKKEGRQVDIDADWVCFDIPNKFIVGFGLDYNEHFRNLPYIGIFDEDSLNKN